MLCFYKDMKDSRTSEMEASNEINLENCLQGSSSTLNYQDASNVTDETKTNSPTSSSPQSGNCSDLLTLRLEELDDSVVDRILDLEKIDVESFLPSLSPVSVEVTLLDAAILKTSSEVGDTIDRTVPPVELPESQGQPKYDSKERPDSLQVHFNSSRGTGNEGRERGRLASVDGFDEDLLDPTILDRKSATEVLELFYSQDKETIVKLQDYWERFREFHKIGERVSTLLNNRGVKLKRKKRMGTEVPADEKKEIRAQRNRERSQALRRHQKQRFMGLEALGQQLQQYNSAVRSVINCLLEDDKALPLLQVYFSRNKCSEALLAFLTHEE